MFVKIYLNYFIITELYISQVKKGCYNLHRHIALTALRCPLINVSHYYIIIINSTLHIITGMYSTSKSE
jgi:hypothetical protein